MIDKHEAKYIFGFLDALLGVDAELDYAGALNGLQVEGPPRFRRIGAAVDASERVLRRAADEGADLVIVHHGLFWDPERRVTGRRFRKVRTLISNRMALYSSHLPLDRHPEVGNSALLMRALGVEPTAPFGQWKGTTLGWQGETSLPVDRLRTALSEVVEGPVRMIQGGPSDSARLAVVTGAASSLLQEAADAGIDTLITGEAPHHAFHDAHELGVNLLLGGHYRTETLGVKAVAQRLGEEVGLPWSFIDDPSGF